MTNYLKLRRVREPGSSSPNFALFVPLLAACLISTKVFSRAEDLDRVVTFSIGQQPIRSALLEFSRQARIQVLMSPDIDSGTEGPNLNARVPASTALAILLRNTGLQYVAVGRSISVSRVSSNSAAAAGGIAFYSASNHELRDDQGSDALTDDHAANQVRTTESAPEQKQRAGALEEVLVTAQKREERLQNVPISISVLNNAQLESPTIASASDALSTIAGVAINSNYFGGGTNVTVRGVSAPAALYAGTSPVAYYLDGMPFGLVTSAIAPDQDAYDLQRVEVLKGPQGTLYGASALNGVVRILTNDADLTHFDFKVRAQDSYTDFGGNNYGGDAAINAPIIDGKLAMRAVVGYEDNSGYIDSPLGRNFNDSQLRNYRVKINAQPIEDFTAGLLYWRSRDNFSGPSTGNDSYKNTELNREPLLTGFDATSLRVAYGSSGYSISNTASYLKYNDNTAFDFNGLLGFPLLVLTELQSEVVSDEFLVTSQNSSSLRWNIGTMYRRATESGGSLTSLFGDAATGPVQYLFGTGVNTSRSYAVFGELTKALMDDRLELTGGLRWFEDRQWADGAQTLDTSLSPIGLLLTPLPHIAGEFVKTTPRAVITWHQSTDLTIYGSFAEGFRSGILNGAVNADTFIPPAKADTLYNYELGTKGSAWNGLLSFESAVYYMYWKDVQQSLDIPLNVGGQTSYTGAVVNGQSASGPGIDLSLTIRPIESLTLGIAGDWNKLELDKDVYSSGVVFFPKGGRLNSSPETTLSGSGAYAFALGQNGLRGRLSVGVTYTSAQVYRVNPGGPDIIPGVGDPMVIGRVAMALESRDHWSATLFVNNVSNERGAIVRPFYSPDLTSRIRPLTGGLQLEYHFR